MTSDLYAPSDVDASYDAWKANCGPCALAALLGVSIADVRRGFFSYPARPWCAPTALRLLGRRGASVPRKAGDRTLSDGLAYVQFTGPWTAPGAPPRWAYRHTHWIAVARGGAAIYDANVGDWIRAGAWAEKVVPYLLEDVQRADGGWWLKTTIEVCATGANLERP